MRASNSEMSLTSYSITTRLKSPVTSVRTRLLGSPATPATSFNCTASLLACPGLATKQLRMTNMSSLLRGWQPESILSFAQPVRPAALRAAMPVRLADRATAAATHGPNRHVFRFLPSRIEIPDRRRADYEDRASHDPHSGQ